LSVATAVPAAIGIVVLPMYAALAPARELRRLILMGAVLGGSVAILIFLLIGPAIPLFFGSQFSPAISPGRILALACGPLVLRDLVLPIIFGSGKPGRSSFVELCSTAALFIALAALPPVMGLDGVAWAVVAFYAIGAIVAIYLARVDLNELRR
jgi:O-antigen/teichoic acid export membrane protein